MTYDERGPDGRYLPRNPETNALLRRALQNRGRYAVITPRPDPEPDPTDPNTLLRVLIDSAGVRARNLNRTLTTSPDDPIAETPDMNALLRTALTGPANPTEGHPHA